MSAPVRKDFLGWAATAFALVVTFSAEYDLAKAVGIHHLVALAVPGALDVYVLRALQVKRDVFLTVLAMIAVNAASHLVTAGVLAVGWPLIVAVSAIAPLVLWRSHVLGGFRGTGEWRARRKAKLWDVPEHVAQEVEHTSTDTVSVPGHDDFDQIEAAWRAPEPEHTAAVLSFVPPVEAGTLLEDDKKYLDRARTLFEHGSTPTLRALKAHTGTGTERARRLRDYLITEHGTEGAST